MVPPKLSTSRASASTCSRLSARNATSHSPTRSFEKVAPACCVSACLIQKLPPELSQPALRPSYSQVAG